jgi:hypothetical protein
MPLHMQTNDGERTVRASLQRYVRIINSENYFALE